MFFVSFQGIKLVLIAARYFGEDRGQEGMNDGTEKDQRAEEVERLDFYPMDKLV